MGSVKLALSKPLFRSSPPLPTSASNSSPLSPNTPSSRLRRPSAHTHAQNHANPHALSPPPTPHPTLGPDFDNDHHTSSNHAGPSTTSYPLDVKADPLAAPAASSASPTSPTRSTNAYASRIQSLDSPRPSSSISLSSPSRERHHSDAQPPPYEQPQPGPECGAALPLRPDYKARVPSMLVLVREDYQRTRVYVREMDYKQALRKALRKHMYKWYALAAIIIAIAILLSVKHEDIVTFCEPLTRRIRHWPVGWLIPVVLLIVVSFPPLMGHEIIGILCGLVWGLWIGFAILAAGTFLGEMALWTAFKWCCQGRATKFEKKSSLYFSLTQLIREKTFTFVLVLRFSAIPGHIVTAVSASAGANYWQYLLAAFLTLPKQFTIVYLGKAFGQKNHKNTIISICTTVATLIATVIAAVYVYYQMRLVMLRSGTGSGGSSAASTSSMLQPDGSPEITVSMAEVELRRGSTICPGAMKRYSEAAVYAMRNGEDHSSASDNGAGSGSTGPMARRPYVSRTSSYSSQSSRVPLRSWSLPGPLSEEEMRDWSAEMESNAPTPLFRPVDDASPGSRSARRFRSPSPVPSEWSALGGLGGTDAGSTVQLLQDRDRIASWRGSPPTPRDLEEGANGFFRAEDGDGEANTSIEYPPSPSPRNPQVQFALSQPYGRGAVSLDISRPSSRATNTQSVPYPILQPSAPGLRLASGRAQDQRQGGREIADEADAYAYSRGGRRPDFARLRGDSRAALLGRPDEEDLLARSEEWAPRSRSGTVGSVGSGRSVSVGRSAMPAEGAGGRAKDLLTPERARDIAAENHRKERADGRPRGPSGASLLGRPDL